MSNIAFDPIEEKDLALLYQWFQIPSVKNGFKEFKNADTDSDYKLLIRKCRNNNE